MLRETPNNESIIVEYGFADSTGDDVNQIKNNWQELTEAVVRALANYIGVPYIPPTGSESNYYTVKKGDTLYSIARNYGITVNELKSANNLTSDSLTIGQTLMIPTKESTPSTSENTYIVKAGDSLYKIANMYNMTVNELKSLNNLSSDLLSIGQVLKVLDDTSTSTGTYTVKAGDSLYKIANMYNMTVNELKILNNLSSDLLSIGQVLKVLDNASMEANTYIVKSGDTTFMEYYNIKLNN